MIKQATGNGAEHQHQCRDCRWIRGGCEDKHTRDVCLLFIIYLLYYMFIYAAALGTTAVMTTAMCSICSIVMFG
jgi:hypothetical protein